MAADWQTLQTPETYVGYGQSTGFASRGRRGLRRAPRLRRARAAPPQLLGPLGDWTVARHAAVANEPGGRIAFQFHARDLNLVMGPASRGASIPFRVFLDGQLADGAHGTDVASDGSGIVDDQRTYQLIRQPGPIADRRFEIEFLDAGVEAYCFTFG